MGEKEKKPLLYVGLMGKSNIGMRAKLTGMLLLVKILPIILLAVLSIYQISALATQLREIAVADSNAALNARAVESIERLTTDTARDVADFLYRRDDDILYLAKLYDANLSQMEKNFKAFSESRTNWMVRRGQWALDAEGKAWVRTDAPDAGTSNGDHSTNHENNYDPDNPDNNGFNYRDPESFDYEKVYLYDEITFFDTTLKEQAKYVSENGVETGKNVYMPNGKKHEEGSEIRAAKAGLLLDTKYQLDDPNGYGNFKNTFVQAETYPAEIGGLEEGDIYVSDVIGKYVGTNYIGMYTEGNFAAVSANRVDQVFSPENQAYAGAENPNGERFAGIVRWVTPVYDGGSHVGYVSLALNHDHIMEFVDHITPTDDRYTDIPSAYEGNYAFIWDYECRNIAHPRHHSITGYDDAGNKQTPWLQDEIYSGWKASEYDYWYDYVTEESVPVFNNQSRDNKPAAALTERGLVGLDGRYLNNAPQCTGWMDLTRDGGSGSFYIKWSGLWKLNTAGAIPYYTGQYSPAARGNLRGFGFVAIGAGLDDFKAAAQATAAKLSDTIDDGLSGSVTTLMFTVIGILASIVFIAVMIANGITRGINDVNRGLIRFRSGERQFRFKTRRRDEIGMMADSFDDMADSVDESVKNPLTIIDMDTNIIYMNDYGLKFRNNTLNNIVGTKYGDASIYPPNTEYCPITALLEGREASIYYDENSGKYLQGVASYFTDNTGAKKGYIVETYDQTEMIKQQHALENAVEAANSASRHKGDFLARMSHEIRTPMNAVIGLTDIVLKKLADMETTGDTKELSGYLSQIDSSSKHLLGLLNDILDISKIEAGKIELVSEAVSLGKLLGTVSGMIKPRCDEKNIKLITDFCDVKPDDYKCDSLRLRQVLINLLGNAVKFTGELGMISFKVEMLDDKERETFFRFSVTDTGIGISKDAQSAVFEAFEQAGGSITKKYGGTGLGLAISKRIVELLGGQIELESEPGEGSTFSFAIWLEKSDVPAKGEIEISSVAGKFKGKRVLLVDDVDINRMIVRSMLEETEADIDEADDGQKAIDAFAASQPNYYDIVLMDIKMPNVDGYDAASAIRTMPREDAKSVPIIALTANAFKDDIDNAIKHGMNAHISKPVESAVLYPMLMKYLGCKDEGA